MPEILSRFTRMPVQVASDGLKVEPNSIYLIPPSKSMSVKDGALYLEEPAQPAGLRLPIDFFFRSLSMEKGPDAIGIILSGTGMDGTLGLRAIKAEQGTIFVQDPESAKYDGMPRSAIDTGLADFVLKPDMMPEKLIKFLKHSAINGAKFNEQMKASGLLRETRDYLENLLNYANAPIIVWNPEFKITVFNHAFEQLTGQSAGDVLGKKMDALIPEEQRKEAMEKINRTTMKGERLEVVEIPIQHVDGSTRIVLWNSATLFAPDGTTMIATIAQGQDITERKKAEEDSKAGKEALEMTNRELESYSYSISHDLRAPLRTLDGFSEAVLLDYGDKLDEQGKDYLNRIRNASQTMAHLIYDILKLSRVTRGEIHRDNINLSNLARKIEGEIKAAQPERKADFVIQPDITAYGDPGLLEIALRNLIDNAWKFTGKNPQTRIEFGTTSIDGKQVYFLKDNGVGFDTRYADKLFQPFKRLHTTVEFPGTGVGLATVQRIIQRHGGNIWAESSQGKGTTFYFTLGKVS
jgi:PAS domain S-box-containing protein